jgi:hypothetical protein
MNECLQWSDLFLETWFEQYICFAYAVILFRIFTRRFTKAEWLLLALLIGHHALEVFQQWTGDGFRLTQLYVRYYQVIAPLAWGWTAWGLIALWKWRKDLLGIILRVCIVAFIAEVFVYNGIVRLSHEYRKGTVRDRVVAGRHLTPYILEDYKGPKRHENFPYSTREYFTSRRPVIRNDYGSAIPTQAFNGQIALPIGPYPLEEDYYVRRLDKNVSKYPPLPESRYEFITEVKGSRYKWRLYRRKDTCGLPQTQKKK